jgi:hypothetical protein
MLSVASSHLGRVDASNSKREYLCSIVGFMPLFNLGEGVIETSKVVDVLLPLGRKQYSCVQRYLLCLHYAVCLMQLSVVRNLILKGSSDDSPRVDFSHRCSWITVYVFCCNT